MIGGKDLINVWEDTYLEYSGDTLDFRVYRNGTLVYEGYAEKFPDGTPIRIYINRIARDYLYNGDFNPSENGITTDSGATDYFHISRVYNGGSEQGLGGIDILYGFSGDAVNGSLLNEPVNRHADMRQKCLATNFFITL